MSSTASLSLEQAPPISVPFRFFLTAPLFGILTGLLIAWIGPPLFSHRWTSSALAATHLLTLGYITMTMAGAMMQMLPVLASAPVPKVRAVAWIIHIGLTAGTLALALAFLNPTPRWFFASAHLLGLTLSIFVVAVSVALIKARSASHTVLAMRLAVISLVITALLGVTLALSLSGHLEPPRLPQHTNVHLTWGLLGWVGLLIMGVAFQVVPMFEMTPEYGLPSRRLLPSGVFVLLLIWTLGYYLDQPLLRLGGIVPLLLLAALFAALTIRLHLKRRRKLADTTLLYWQFGMGLAFVSALLWLCAALPDTCSWPATTLLPGVIVIVGVILSLINGMLLKIFSFLSWFHLQHRQIQTLRPDIQVPNMKEFVSTEAASWQMWLHVLSVAALLSATIAPDALARTSGILFSVSQALLLAILAQAAYRYRRVSKQFLRPPTIPASIQSIP